MYFRQRKLESVLALAENYILDGLVPGQFLKIGMDEVDGVRSYWLFAKEGVDGDDVADEKESK